MNIIDNINAIVGKFNDGELSAIDCYLQLNSIEKTVSEAKDQIKNFAYDEVEATGEKIYKRNGFEIQCQSKTTWKYDHLQSWNDAKNKLKSIEEKAQLATKSGLNGNFETGEIIEPAIASYSYYLKVK